MEDSFLALEILPSIANEHSAYHPHKAGDIAWGTESHKFVLFVVMGSYC